MWQAPSQRLRAAAAARKRERERQKLQLRMKRVRAELKILGGLGKPSPITEARMILNDIGAKGVGLFLSEPVMVGSEVALTLEEPKRFYVRGRVIACQEYSADSHVLSQNSYSYRVGIEFTFESEAERDSVKVFVDQIAREFLFAAPVKKAA